jgi:hypothetical protein
VSFTLLIVGSAIIPYGVVIPERLGMALEFCVALMLIVLGLLNLGSLRRNVGRSSAKRTFAPPRFSLETSPRDFSASSTDWLVSAAVALLVLPLICNPAWAVFYLSIFAVGTVAGMMLITAIIAVPITYSANRFQLFNRYVGAAAGALSLAFGLFLVHQIGFVDGLFDRQFAPETFQKCPPANS